MKQQHQPKAVNKEQQMSRNKTATKSGKKSVKQSKPLGKVSKPRSHMKKKLVLADLTRGMSLEPKPANPTGVDLLTAKEMTDFLEVITNPNPPEKQPMVLIKMWWRVVGKEAADALNKRDATERQGEEAMEKTFHDFMAAAQKRFWVIANLAHPEATTNQEIA